MATAKSGIPMAIFMQGNLYKEKLREMDNITGQTDRFIKDSSNLDLGMGMDCGRKIKDVLIHMKESISMGKIMEKVF